jgi:hypothetical protein
LKGFGRKSSGHGGTMALSSHSCGRTKNIIDDSWHHPSSDSNVIPLKYKLRVLSLCHPIWLVIVMLYYCGMLFFKSVWGKKNTQW